MPRRVSSPVIRRSAFRSAGWQQGQLVKPSSRVARVTRADLPVKDGASCFKGCGCYAWRKTQSIGRRPPSPPHFARMPAPGTRRCQCPENGCLWDTKSGERGGKRQKLSIHATLSNTRFWDTVTHAQPTDSRSTHRFIRSVPANHGQCSNAVETAPPGLFFWVIPVSTEQRSHVWGPA